jgi:hypothetical protein
MFFDQIIIDYIVAETNRYADCCIENSLLKCRSRMKNWQPVTSYEIYVVLGLIMVMGVEERPTLKPYFSRDAFIETDISTDYDTDRYELIMKFLHFVGNSTVDMYTGGKEIFKIHLLLEIKKSNFFHIFRN